MSHFYNILSKASRAVPSNTVGRHDCALESECSVLLLLFQSCDKENSLRAFGRHNATVAQELKLLIYRTRKVKSEVHTVVFYSYHTFYRRRV